VITFFSLLKPLPPFVLPLLYSRLPVNLQQIGIRALIFGFNKWHQKLDPKM
jgi:hypothetical protein